MPGIEIKTYSKKQLAALYNVSPKVLRNWLRPHLNKIGKYTGKTYTPKQIKIIIELIDEPMSVE
jgi:hypothetical protein